MTSELKSPVRKFEDTFSAEKIVLDKFFISAALDVPELVRLDPVIEELKSGDVVATMVVEGNGEYVRYDQAAAVIALEKQAAIDARNLLQYEKDQQWQERSEAAETVITAKEAEIASWKHVVEKAIEGEIKSLDKLRAAKAKLAQIEKQEIYAYDYNGELVYNIITYINDEVTQNGIALYTAPISSDADLRAENEDLRKAVEQIAKQKLVSEIPLDDYENAAFEDAYDMMIEISRAALKPSEPKI